MSEPKTPEPAKPEPAKPQPSKLPPSLSGTRPAQVDPRIRAAQLGAAPKPKDLPPRAPAAGQQKLVPPGPAAPAKPEAKPAAARPAGGAPAKRAEAPARPAPPLPQRRPPKTTEAPARSAPASRAPAEGAVDEAGFPLDALAGLSEEDRIQQFILGNITLSQLQGLSHAQLYSLAEIGSNFYKQGQYEKSRSIFEGLVVMDPTDSWLHLCLGLCFGQMNDDYRAVLEFDRAIFLNEMAIQPRLERAEILMKYGELEMAVQDLAKAVELDKGGEDPYALRSRVLLDALRQMVENPAAKPGQGAGA
jgi:tetratricopeptide (TPR) repeat protein